MGMLEDWCPSPCLQHVVSSWAHLWKVVSKSAAEARKTSTWKGKWCSAIVEIGLKTDQGTLRRTLCNRNSPVYVAGGITRGRETSLPWATVSSSNYKGQKQRKPILPSLHGVIPPLMLKLLFVWYLRVKAQTMSSLVLSCRGLSVAMGVKNRDYSFSSPLGRCISLFWVSCEAATPPKCAGV